MTDLEQAIRETLRAQAERADRPVRLADGVAQLIRGRRRRRKLAAAGVSAAAIAVAAVLPAALLAGGGAATGPVPVGGVQVPPGVPVTNTAATPPGWAPVPWAGAQISVPSSWLLEGSSGFYSCMANPAGMVFAGQPILRSIKECSASWPAASIAPIPVGPAPSRSAASTLVVNGLPVTVRTKSARYDAYLVPELGVRVTARGPQAGQVVATITRSPLSVALGSGPALQAPSSWRWWTFGGLRFAAPASWASASSAVWGSCVYPTRAVVLSTAVQVFTGSCPAMVPTAASGQAQPFLIDGAGPAAAAQVRHVGEVRCLRRGALTICLSRFGYGTDALTLTVYWPGAPRPTVVQIGVAGDGVTGRTIFDSIRRA